MIDPVSSAITLAKNLPWKAIGIAAGVLAVVGAVWWQVDSYGDRREKAGRDAVQAEWDKDIAVRQKAYTALVEDYRARELAWRAKADKARQERTNEDARTIAGLERTIAGLRNRPERPSVPRAAPTPGVDAASEYRTGAFLHREDGEFLAREAARADRLRTALKECYAVSNPQ